LTFQPTGRASIEPGSRKDSQMQQMTLRVIGMSCEGCEDRIKTALNRVDGIRFASADHESERVRVAFDPAVTSSESVTECIEKAGYKVAGTVEASP